MRGCLRHAAAACFIFNIHAQLNSATASIDVGGREKEKTETVLLRCSRFLMFYEHTQWPLSCGVRKKDVNKANPFVETLVHEHYTPSISISTNLARKTNKPAKITDLELTRTSCAEQNYLTWASLTFWRLATPDQTHGSQHALQKAHVWWSNHLRPTGAKRANEWAFALCTTAHSNRGTRPEPISQKLQTWLGLAQREGRCWVSAEKQETVRTEQLLCCHPYFSAENLNSDRTWSCSHSKAFQGQRFKLC